MEAEKSARECREAKSELSSKEKLLVATDRELKSLQSKYNDVLNRANNAEAELKTIKPGLGINNRALSSGMPKSELAQIFKRSTLVWLENRSVFEFVQNPNDFFWFLDVRLIDLDQIERSVFGRFY